MEYDEFIKQFKETSPGWFKVWLTGDLIKAFSLLGFLTVPAAVGVGLPLATQAVNFWDTVKKGLLGAGLAIAVCLTLFLFGWGLTALARRLGFPKN